VFICRVRPVDGDVEWTERVKLFNRLVFVPDAFFLDFC